MNEYRHEIPLENGMLWVIHTYPFDGGYRETEHFINADVSRPDYKRPGKNIYPRNAD